MNKSRAVSLAACAILVFLAGVLLGSLLQAYRERREGERFLALLRQIEVGSTSHDTVLELALPFRDHIEEDVQNGLPELNFWFDNRAIARLRIASHSRFTGRIIFKDGVVVEKHATEFVSASGCAAKVTESVRGFGFVDGTAPPNHPNHHVDHNWNPGNHVRGIFIRDDHTLGATQRTKDWNFDLSCLTALGGCSDARTMLPDVRIAEPAEAVK